MRDPAMDMCQHVPKFTADKTCLDAPGEQNIGKMWIFVKFGRGQHCELGVSYLHNYLFFGNL